MRSIFARELRAYFTSAIGYVFVVFMLAAVGVYAASLVFFQRFAYFEYVLINSLFVFMIAIPILTMRSLADDRHNKTLQFLYALPVGVKGIVIGKYLAMCVVFLIPCLLYCLYPLIMLGYGMRSAATAFSSIFAFYMLGCALIALGLFISSLTEFQFISALMSFGAILLLYLASTLASRIPGTALVSFLSLVGLAAAVGLLGGLLTRSLGMGAGLFAVLAVILSLVYLRAPQSMEGLITRVLQSISPFDGFYGFAYGEFSLAAIVYDLLFGGLFLFFTVQVLEKRRWQ